MNTRRFCLSIAILLLLAEAAAGATTTFTIQMKVHAGMPAARVRVTFELAAPAAGGTVSVGGASAPIPGPPLLFNTSPAGDPPTEVNSDQLSVATVAATGTAPDKVVLTWTPNTMFNQTGSVTFCQLDPGVAGDPSLTVTLNTPAPATITGYRINTYTAAGSTGATAESCNNTPRRIIANEATISFSAGTTPPFRGRHPLDIVLILDQSGSMSSRPPGLGSGPDKWTILESAIGSFVTKWKVAGAPSGTQSWPTDRLGLVFFDTTAEAGSLGPAASFIIARGDTGAAFDEVTSDVAAEAPEDLTALGAGINTALTQWLAPATAPRNDAVFVIMSDGVQNVSPKVEPIPMSVVQTLATSAAPGAPQVPLYTYGIPMQGIGFGPPDTEELKVLDGIGLQTGGMAIQAIANFDVIDAFNDTLVTILKGGTLSLARREQATLTGTTAPLVPVFVDGSVRRAMFSVDWTEGRQERLDLQVFPPGTPTGPGDTGITPTQTASSSGTVSYGFDMPASGATGIWQVRVVRPLTTFISDTPYNLSAHMVEGRLRYQFTFDEIERGTGDQIGIRAELAFDGAALDGLPPNAIQVSVARPQDGMGNILHNANVDIPPGGGPDPSSPYSRKIDALADAGGLLSRITPTLVSTITLTGQGNGIYTGSFSGTNVPGLYRFNATLDWDQPATGRIHRIERFERTVKVNADERSSEIRVDDLGGGSFNVTVTPRDRFGNYVGPGYAKHIFATAARGTIAGAPVDVNQTGDYVYRIDGVPAGATPDVDFVVDGRPIGGTIGGTSGGGPGGAPASWRFFIDGGINSPDSGLDGSFSINGGIERIVTSNISVEGILGYHRFDGPFADPDALQLSANAKYFFGTGALRPFLNGGVGVYRIDPPDDTSFGWNVGGGVLYELNSRWGVEGVFNRHDTDLDWWTLQLGLRWSF